MPPKHHRHFGPIAGCNLSDYGNHVVAADLDGTLLVFRSSFPYFFLLATEADNLLRAASLFLFSPLILVTAGIQIMIFVTTVRTNSYKIFWAHGRRRLLVTANLTVMVEAFVREYLGADGILGMELQVDSRGSATGFVAGRGVLIGERKRDALLKEFGDELPEVGLGDRKSDHNFMELCKMAEVHPILITKEGILCIPCWVKGKTKRMKTETTMRDPIINLVMRIIIRSYVGDAETYSGPEQRRRFIS